MIGLQAADNLTRRGWNIEEIEAKQNIDLYPQPSSCQTEG